MDTNETTPTFRRLPETEALINHLATLPEGTVITHLQMVEAAGMKSDEKVHLRSILSSARKELVKRGIVFGSVHGVGIKRLIPDEVVDYGESSVARLRRAAKRCSKTLLTADTKRLKPEKLTGFNLRVTQLKLMEHAAKRESESTLLQNVIVKKVAFTPAEALKLLQ